MNKTIDCIDLYHRCCSDDPTIQDAAYTELGELLLRIGQFRTQSKPHLYHHVEECVQEALVGIWQKLSSGNGPETPARFCAWCTSIMIYKTIDMLRREGYINRDADKPLPTEQETSIDDPSDAGDNPEQEPADPKTSHLESDMMDRAMIDALLDVIVMHSRLTENEKFVLIYGFFLDYTDIELAALLQKTRDNIRLIRHRGLEKLKDDDDLKDRLHGWLD